MSGCAQVILQTYSVASGGHEAAYHFLLAWHGWCHAIDDHVDEGRPPEQAVDLCADAAVVFSSPFYSANVLALAPVVSVVAAKYRASLGCQGKLADALRIAGNDMVLAVAYLTGGAPAVRQVSAMLWPIVLASQLDA